MDYMILSHKYDYECACKTCTKFEVNLKYLILLDKKYESETKSTNKN